MKMRPTVNSDEFVSANRSGHVARYADHSSRRPKEQISASKNAQTEYEAHLSQNAAYPSTYGPNDRQTIRHGRHVNIMEEGRRDVTRNHEKTEQNHKGVDTRDIDSLRRSKKSCCIELRLFCLRLCRAKKRYSRRVSRKPRRLLERIKARSKECLRPDDAVVVAGPSTAPYLESISYRDAPKKSRERRHKQDEPAVEEVADEDVSEDIREEQRERRKRAREERRKEEKRERRERRKREEHALHPVDSYLIARDDDLDVVDDRVPVKPPAPLTDFAKSCCYLCAQNTLAIATAATIPRPEQSDKGVQVSPHKFYPETFRPTLDKSCSPVLLVRTVQSSVKVKTRETGTMWCPGTTAVPREEETGPRVKKRKKFLAFPGLTRTKCPAGRHAACETDKSAVRRDNAEKRERCCREKNAA
ncbi:uncharacterized protein LOC105840250 [Monomorium pharaonis]|uniref:uncharacterized protein LOC105840250 n=1 Tax=Monomorium pharaonis TaxID=307658 RepID=UPI001746B124|nr:uncharacterized protein LOC105840250 [Monomorium pharaonis]